MWNQVFFLLLAIFLIGILYLGLRGGRKQFTRKNLSKSFWTMGWLALLLIVFIALLVMFVRQF